MEFRLILTAKLRVSGTLTGPIEMQAAGVATFLVVELVPPGGAVAVVGNFLL